MESLNTTKTIIMPVRGFSNLQEKDVKSKNKSAVQGAIKCNSEFLSSYITANPSAKNKDGSIENPFKTSGFLKTGKQTYNASDFSYQLSDDKNIIQLGYKTNGKYVPFHSFSVEAFKNNPSIGDIEIKNSDPKTIRTMSAVDVLIACRNKEVYLLDNSNTTKTLKERFASSREFIFDKEKKVCHIVIPPRRDGKKDGLYDADKIYGTYNDGKRGDHNGFGLTDFYVEYSGNNDDLSKRLFTVHMEGDYNNYNFFKDNKILDQEGVKFKLSGDIKVPDEVSYKDSKTKKKTKENTVYDKYVTDLCGGFSEKIKNIYENRTIKIKAEKKLFVAQYNKIIFDNIPKDNKNNIKLLNDQSSLDELMKENAKLKLVVDGLENKKEILDNIKNSRSEKDLTQENLKQLFGQNGVELFKMYYNNAEKLKEDTEKLENFLNNRNMANLDNVNNQNLNKKIGK